MASEIRVCLEDDLEAEVLRRIEAGEFRDQAELVTVAIRYYLERHPDGAWAEYVEKEVAWSRQHAVR